MPHYVILGNWTEQGARNLKEAPKRDEAARREVEKAGGKLQTYYTFGRYDFVAIAEAPNDEAMLRVLLKIASQGNARTTTLRAWTEAETTKLIAEAA